MGETTKIQWCDHTLNPWVGCQKVHAGCTNCYAEDMMDKRYGKAQWGPQGTRVLTSTANWKKPLAWDRQAGESGERRRVFCGSLCDWAEDWQGPLLGSDGLIERIEAGNKGDMLTMDDARFRLLDMAAQCSNLNWLFLTKRPERVAGILRAWLRGQCGRESPHGAVRIPSNWWFGCSVSDQETADRLVPELLAIRKVAPDSKLFVSYEPALGPVDWTRITAGCLCPQNPDHRVDVLRGGFWSRNMGFVNHSDMPSLDWLIIGGESGPHARPCNVDWIRNTVEQCNLAVLPVFVKQMGSWCHDDFGENRCWWPGLTQFRQSDVGFRVILRDPKGGEPSEWPEGLQVRQVPREEA